MSGNRNKERLHATNQIPQYNLIQLSRTVEQLVVHFSLHEGRFYNKTAIINHYLITGVSSGLSLNIFWLAATLRCSIKHP